MDAIDRELQREDEIRAEAQQAVREALLTGRLHPERIVSLWRAAREILRNVLVDMYYRI